MTAEPDAQTLALMVETANAPLLLARALGLPESDAPSLAVGIERLAGQRDQARADADRHALNARELAEQHSQERARLVADVEALRRELADRTVENGLLTARVALLRTAHERNARGERSTPAERTRIPALRRIFGEVTDYMALQAFRLRSGIALDDDDTASGRCARPVDTPPPRRGTALTP